MNRCCIQKYFVLLLSIFVISCSGNRKNGTKEHTNFYSSFENLINAETFFSEKYDDTVGKHFFYDFSWEGAFQKSYQIHGICYCIAENNKENHGKQGICENLKYRTCSILNKLDNDYCLLSFQNIDSYDFSTLSGLSWEKRNRGGCTISQGCFDLEEYYLVNNKDEKLGYLEFSSGFSKETQKEVFKTIQDSVVLENIVRF